MNKEKIQKVIDAIKELVSIVNIHSEETENNFAWAELEEAYKALSIMQEELDNTGQFNPDWTNYRQGRVDGFQEALEKKPLSDVEISKAFCDETGVSIGDTIEDAFEAGVRFGEKYHGIGVE